MAKRETGKKEDQRVRLTKTMLQNAFLELLREKPVQSVSVKELCERAGVNRGTFYLHYHDVYDLLLQMQNEMLADLDALLSQSPVIVSGVSQEQSATFISALFGFFERNREMCAVLLGDNGDKKFVADIVERAREKSIQEYTRLFPHAGRQKTELFYYFIAWGFIGLIQHSLQTPGGVSFKTVAAAAERIVAEAAGYFTEPGGAG